MDFTQSDSSSCESFITPIILDCQDIEQRTYDIDVSSQSVISLNEEFVYLTEKQKEDTTSPAVYSIAENSDIKDNVRLKSYIIFNLLVMTFWV